MRVIEQMEKQADNGDAFVRQDTDSGRWFTLERHVVRVAVAQTFRDQTELSTRYRSSKAAKKDVRKREKLVRQQKQALSVASTESIATSDTLLATFKQGFASYNESTPSNINGQAHHPCIDQPSSKDISDMQNNISAIFAFVDDELDNADEDNAPTRTVTYPTSHVRASTQPTTTSVPTFNWDVPPVPRITPTTYPFISRSMLEDKEDTFKFY